VARETLFSIATIGGTPNNNKKKAYFWLADVHHKKI